MEWYHAVILGIVEGVTEYLPVSSTGHLILTASLMGLTERVDKASLDAFNIVIQGGAILAVLGLYRKSVAQMVRGVMGRDAIGLRLAVNILIAFFPAAVVGLLTAPLVERHLFSPGPVMAALALGGVVMIFIQRWQKRYFSDRGGDEARTYIDLESLTWRRSLIIGLLQCLAMWPGTSRSLVTIVGGMVVGMRPRDAAEFSFLLGVPTLTGACAYRAFKSFTGDGPDMIESFGVMPLIIGMVVAMIAAMIAVRWLVAFLTRHGLALFGWYRLALCAVLGILISQGLVTISPEEAVPATPIVSPE